MVAKQFEHKSQLNITYMTQEWSLWIMEIKIKNAVQKHIER